MYIAMNRFKVIKGNEDEFERRWLGRDTYLDQLPGFVEFNLLRGPDRDDHTLYSSHTVWANKDAFINALRNAARQASTCCHDRPGAAAPGAQSAGSDRERTG